MVPEVSAAAITDLHRRGLGAFAGSDVTLLGAGVETLSVIPHLRAANVGGITLFEQGAIPADRHRILDANGVTVTTSIPARATIVLRSPGLPVYRDDVAALCASARFATTPTGLWLAVRGGTRTIVVTGTKGKSSTATLIATGLENLGVATQLVGNIGTSAWEVDPAFDGVAIVELSSYHGADLVATGAIGVLTLLADDHLDWHGSAAVYRRDKLSVFTTPQANGEPMASCFTTADQHLDGDIAPCFTRVAVDGDHQARNIALAVAAIRAQLAASGEVDIPSIDTLTERLTRQYPHLAGRFETVTEIDGITWIDDALGSNPSATAAALERILPGPAVLICGGHDRRVSLDPVTAVLARWPNGALDIVWLGRDDDHRLAELTAQPAVATHHSVESMAEAVNLAAELATTRVTDPAGTTPTVVFSPLAPTERSQGNWSDRSRAFQAAIAAL